MRTLKLLLMLAALATVSCGGGGSSDGVSLAPPVVVPPTGGIDRGGVSRGVITGFGSIFVNGVRFDTSMASFSIDDNPGSESDLNVGQIVTIIGSLVDDSNGSADQVIFNSEVEGPITSIDAAAGTFVVLGQTIIVDSGTIFDDDIVPNSLSGLSVGQVVEVSGFIGIAGSIVASFIEASDDTEFELTGVVSALDSAAMTFQINGQLIDYSNALLEDFPAGQIENDMRVEAKGSMFGSNNELIATTVEFEDDDFPGDEDDEVEIEGLITRYESVTDFDVAGFPVTTNSSTLFENGSAADLATGVKVEVEGNLNSAGTLVADKVSIRINAEIEIHAPADSIDTSAGTVTVLGLVIATDNVTRYEDDSDAELPMFGLGNISSGDWLEIKAFRDSAGNLRATQIERDDEEDEVRIEASVDTVSRPDLQVLGLTIQTDNNTEFEDANEVPISADEFFGQVDTTRRVQVDGVVISDGVILANEIELEDDDD